MAASPFDALQHLPVFIAAGLALNLTPGADMALVARSSASQGWRAGAAAALGVGAGCWVHTAAAAAGLAAVLAASPLGLALLRWAGAAYLLWLGLALWRSGAGAGRGAAQADDAGGTPAFLRPFWRHFRQGFLTNALNPKVALFFLAFVPQFIRPGAAHPALAFALLGTLFVVNATLVNLAFAAGVAGLRRRLGRQAAWQRLGRWLNCGVGLLFIVLGARLAWGDHPA